MLPILQLMPLDSEEFAQLSVIEESEEVDCCHVVPMRQRNINSAEKMQRDVFEPKGCGHQVTGLCESPVVARQFAHRLSVPNLSPATLARSSSAQNVAAKIYEQVTEDAKALKKQRRKASLGSLFMASLADHIPALRKSSKGAPLRAKQQAERPTSFVAPQSALLTVSEHMGRQISSSSPSVDLLVDEGASLARDVHLNNIKFSTSTLLSDSAAPKFSVPLVTPRFYPSQVLTHSLGHLNEKPTNIDNVEHNTLELFINTPLKCVLSNESTCPECAKPGTTDVQCQSLRNYPTLCGIPEVDVRKTGAFGNDPLSETSSSESFIHLSSSSVSNSSNSASTTTNGSQFLLQFIADSKVEIRMLHLHNKKLQCDVALIRERAKNWPPLISHSRQSSAESALQTLEELRRLHTSLESKKFEFLKTVGKKEEALIQREKKLTEKEVELNRSDEELRQRWDQLNKAWDQNRMHGNFHSLACPESSLAYKNLSGGFTSPSGAVCTLTHSIQRPELASETVDLPHDLSLPVKGRRSSDAFEPPAEPFTRNVHSALSSIGRASLKAKKWYSTSRLSRHSSSLSAASSSQQLIPSKLASTSQERNSNKKK